MNTERSPESPRTIRTVVSSRPPKAQGQGRPPARAQVSLVSQKRAELTELPLSPDVTRETRDVQAEVSRLFALTAFRLWRMEGSPTSLRPFRSVE